VTEPGLDADGLQLEGLELQLLTDDYTANGWLLGAQLSFHGAGRAELTERREARLSFWEITEMPPLVLTDRTGGIESEFRWISEAPSAAETPAVWLDTNPASPSVYLQFLHYRRVGIEDEP
jgi:hypothetical protein